MSKVDSKGRIVLPQHIRRRLGITPGSEVEIHEEDGKAVIEPEDNPDQIIADLENIIEDAAARRDQSDYDELDIEAKRHVDTIRRQANSEETSDE
ncbi:AbrB/MazE/SpoVT family DNA-binding domain-containing protein [Haladaptatus halobius]|jgi:AbrB family looped-hinge helix DNA binding protein|uniref:AbrB/MazE/SpoVT family DNA-binding domain-containing protein n=1 Tax=Haladaptatus halobius TaxID=2884875 RepID=UPI001D0B3C74|nr:AbrB/MazE/SpoVT family DNA-binding domain-containing protein [Haladaptatus halobius]